MQGSFDGSRRFPGRPLPAACILVCCFLAGCSSFAPARLQEDQIGYSRALGESEKGQTLLNVVRIRYGDTPVFLNTTQVISAYQLQSDVNAGLQFVYPIEDVGNFITGSGGVQLQQNPTFTFQPLTGQELAQSIIRPLSPTELLPLVLSGLPIDVLFRLAVQSVNGLQNTQMLASSNRSGSPAFFQLLFNLRRLQMADLLGVRLESAPDAKEDPKAKAPSSDRLILTIGDSSDPALHRTAVETRRLIGMAPGAQEAEVVYGLVHGPGQIAIITRPILGVLGQVGSEIRVPDEDVHQGLTVGTVDDAVILHRPAIVIRSGKERQPDGYAQVQYRGHWYWIDADDFDSKLAFSIVQILLALAQTNPAAGTVVTIPAR